MDKWCKAALAALVLMISACGPTLDHGAVADKAHRPGYFYQTPIYGAKGQITGWLTNYMPEEWEIKVCVEQDLKTVCDWWSVNENDYDTVVIGDAVDRRD